MKTKEKIQFLKRLSFLVKANIPLESCVTTLKSQTRGRRNKKFFDILVAEISTGTPLSVALVTAHKSFRGLPKSIIRIGEESGTLSESLDHLITILEKGVAMRSKIIQAALYPILVALSTLALCGFLVLYIFPKITPIFEGLKVPLPVATRFLMAVSDFIRGNFIWLGFAVVLFALITFFTLKFFKAARLEFSSALMKCPFLGKLVQMYFLGRVANLLATLLESNMKVDEAIVLVSDSISYPIYSQFFSAAARDVSHGNLLSELCLKNKRLFPQLFSNMIAVGEVSGSFSESLKHLAQIYESEFEMSTRMLTQMIEPALMIFMSVLVGFVAISIITPLYSITNNLNH